MDARIRPPRADNLDPLTEYVFRRCANFALHCPCIRLFLPTAISGPLVLYQQLPLCHPLILPEGRLIRLYLTSSKNCGNILIRGNVLIIEICSGHIQDNLSGRALNRSYCYYRHI
jgi:hypothetical protein